MAADREPPPALRPGDELARRLPRDGRRSREPQSGLRPGDVGRRVECNPAPPPAGGDRRRRGTHSGVELPGAAGTRRGGLARVEHRVRRRLCGAWGLDGAADSRARTSSFAGGTEPTCSRRRTWRSPGSGPRRVSCCGVRNGCTTGPSASFWPRTRPTRGGSASRAGRPWGTRRKEAQGEGASFRRGTAGATHRRRAPWPGDAPGDPARRAHGAGSQP